MTFKNITELLDFAIQKEEQAAKFYTDLAKKTNSGSMRKVFEDFAREELGHKAKLIGIKNGKVLAIPSSKVMDLKIAEQVGDVEPGPEMTYQQALVLAMKREKSSFKLYNELANITDNDGIRGTMLLLAQEEAKHKLWFEIEYDDYVLQEN